MSELTGKVAIITGAGRGLGRAEAMHLAQQGVRVVINDINTSDSSDAAHQTVEDIKNEGGEAMAILGDCADSNDAKALMITTLEAWGDMNIMINNAGVLRDATIFNMTDEEFDLVIRVHLRGHFINMRNATAYWRSKAKSGKPVYGRLISTSSEAAIYASPGQPNYAAAKSGITTMTLAAAQLMIRYGITCNVIMPRAATDMTLNSPAAGLFQAPEEGFHQFEPSNVAPLVTYLSSPQASHISGEAFIVWGNMVNVMQRPVILPPHINPEGEKQWNLDTLHNSLSKHFNDDYTAVADGFTVPIPMG